MRTFAEIERLEDEPVIVADHRGIIVRVNASFCSAFRWSPEALSGQPLSVIIPEYLRDAHQMGFSRFLATGKPVILNCPLQLLVLMGDGTEREAEHFIAAEQRGGQWLFAAAVHPQP